MTRLAMACVLWLAAGLAAADLMVMEVVPLRHRLINDVLPTLQPLVVEGGSVTGLGDQLVIHTTPANLAAIKEVLAAIDTRQHNLRITVRQDVHGHTQTRANSLSARLNQGDVGAGIGGPGGGPGASLHYGDGADGVAIESYATHTRDDSANTHFVNAIEGSPAFIGGGQSVPTGQRVAELTPYGAHVRATLEYRNVGAGFYVTPRVAGDEVTLEISPYADRVDRNGGGVIDQHGLNTVVRGRVGEWIALGGASAASTSDGNRELYATDRAHSDVYDVWVKVEVQP